MYGYQWASPPQVSLRPLPHTLTPIQWGWFGGDQPLSAVNILNRTFLQGFWFCHLPSFPLPLNLGHLVWTGCWHPGPVLSQLEESLLSKQSQPGQCLAQHSHGSCFSRSVLHSFLWCEPTTGAKVYLGTLALATACVVSARGEQTQAPWPNLTPDVSSRKCGLPGQSVPLPYIFPKRQKNYSGDTCHVTSSHQPRGASSSFVGLVLHLDHWSDFRSNWATLSISFMSWQGYHVIT